jgi:hypothetical protein
VYRLRGSDHHGRAEEIRNRVEPLAQNDRNLAQQDVARHAAADARDGAKDDGLHKADAMLEGRGRAGDARIRAAASESP